ncbi:MAG: hypothetical protein QOJ89_2117, partial [bacterium]
MFQQIRAERGERGFTLVELLVVIAILGILAGVVVFSLTAVGDNGAAASCKTEKSIATTALAVATNQWPALSGAALGTKALAYLAGTPTYYTPASGSVAAV